VKKKKQKEELRKIKDKEWREKEEKKEVGEKGNSRKTIEEKRKGKINKKEVAKKKKGRYFLWLRKYCCFVHSTMRGRNFRKISQQYIIYYQSINRVCRHSSSEMKN